MNQIEHQDPWTGKKDPCETLLCISSSALYLARGVQDRPKRSNPDYPTLFNVHLASDEYPFTEHDLPHITWETVRVYWGGKKDIFACFTGPLITTHVHLKTLPYCPWPIYIILPYPISPQNTLLQNAFHHVSSPISHLWPCTLSDAWSPQE